MQITPRVLVTTSKDSWSKLPAAVRVTNAHQFASPVEVVSAAQIDWQTVVGLYGWKGLPDWILREYVALVVVETSRGGLGRATYDIVKKFLESGRSVAVVREDKLAKVKEVRLSGEENWANYYGVIET